LLATRIPPRLFLSFPAPIYHMRVMNNGDSIVGAPVAEVPAEALVQCAFFAG
jgi:hypothetical protein